jgi:hypothetical protein
VSSGTVFTGLESLPLAKQVVKVDAAMNYRKRGLTYFSGFDFVFAGHFEVVNPESHDIDVVFVFPVEMAQNKVLLSELSFQVNDKAEPFEHDADIDKVVWTGRLEAQKSVTFDVRFKGRGLESFVYALDPASPVRDFNLEMHVTGGDNYDYPDGVVPAHGVRQSSDTIDLAWHYPALQSGVPIGAILPSQKSFDQIIGTMVIRSWAPFLLFFIGIAALAARSGARLKFYEMYLLAGCYALHGVVTAYFTAFMNFYVAYALACAIGAAMAVAYGRKLLGPKSVTPVLWLIITLQWIPTIAIIAQGYTGLIYTLEIIGGLAVAMYLTTRTTFAATLEQMIGQPQKEVAHAK